MKLSILVTFYNQSQYVDEALSQLLSMNYDFDYEILVGDDGSQDDTVSKLKVWKEKYPDIINYFVMERKEGVTYSPIERAAFNRVNLLKHAKGEFVCFLDGDDFYCDKNKFIDQINILDQNPALVAAATNCYLYWNEDKKEVMNVKDVKTKIFKAKDYWRYKYFHISTFIFRNVFLNKEMDFDPKCFDDNYITFVFLKHGDVYYSNKITSCYRQTEDSVWNETNQIEQDIINLMDYQFEIEYNKDFKKECLYRHLKEFYSLKKANVDLSKINPKIKARLDSTGVDIYNLMSTKIRFMRFKIFLNKVNRKIKRI